MGMLADDNSQLSHFQEMPLGEDNILAQVMDLTGDKPQSMIGQSSGEQQGI